MTLKSDEELGAALRHWYDISDRAILPFFLLGMTARRVKDDKGLWGHDIQVGVRRRDFTKQVKGTINNYRTYVYGKAGELESPPQSGDTVEFEHKGTPIYVHVIGDDDWRYKYIKNLDFAYHKADNFKVPNPFEDYWKEYETRRKQEIEKEKERQRKVVIQYAKEESRIKTKKSIPEKGGNGQSSKKVRT